MSITTQGMQPPPGPPPIPELHNGDRMTREEFHRRYEALPHIPRAELIEGVVYMPSPVRQGKHGKPHAHLIGWIVAYSASTPGVEASDNGTIKLDGKNEPQPDGFLYIHPEYGGQVRFDDKDYVVGAPEWIGEIAASSANIDLHDKLNAYRRNGVKEYMVWRVLEQALDWFVLAGQNYEPLPPAADGLLKSRVFPGLWLDAAALLAGDMRRVLDVVQAGAQSAEHAAFVRELKQRRAQA
jgi:hypothetical protein